MPDHRRHRGAHPEDARLFAPDRLPALRTAVQEYSWLLSRSYPRAAALKLVGDHHALTDRQRTAVGRAACSDLERERRVGRRLPLAAMAGEEVALDGFNLLITLEAALSGGALLRCRDGCTRDLASIHGSYRSVEETEAALLLAGELLTAHAPRRVVWLLDRPVSNSGRLAERIRALAEERGWPWEAECVFNPDADLRAGTAIVVSSDSAVVEGSAR